MSSPRYFAISFSQGHLPAMVALADEPLLVVERFTSKTMLVVPASDRRSERACANRRDVRSHLTSPLGTASVRATPRIVLSVPPEAIAREGWVEQRPQDPQPDLLNEAVGYQRNPERPQAA